MSLFLAILTFFLSLLPAVATFAEVIYIGISMPGLYELPTEIAQRKGFYKEEGLESVKLSCARICRGFLKEAQAAK